MDTCPHASGHIHGLIGIRGDLTNDYLIVSIGIRLAHFYKVND